jgi:hypothetical protein
MTMTDDLEARLPTLLPKAIAWAEQEAVAASQSGRALVAWELDLARAVGVTRPELIRLALVEALPKPTDPELLAAAMSRGMFGPTMVGLTVGHSVLIRKGSDDARLFSHEFRHVYQYEQAGSIPAFLPGYLQQVVRFGYENAPFEKDAKAHERT